MPYNNERASRIGHLPLAQSPVITTALSRWQVPLVDPASPTEIQSRLMPVDALLSPPRPECVTAFAFDGSNQEVEVRTDYPSVRVGYIQVAGVMVKLKEFFESRVDLSLIHI